MPREPFPISQFKGIFPNADPLDLPAGMSPWATNLDILAGPTRIQGRKGETTLTQTTLPPERYAWLLRDDGQYDLIYWSKYTNEIRATKDFYGTMADVSLMSLGNVDTVTLQPYGSWIIVGLKGEKAKIVGYFSHKGMNNLEGGGELQITDFDIGLPASIPHLSKVAVDATYTYGFEYNASALYKITNADSTVVTVDGFNAIKSLCLADANHLWVLDTLSYGNYRLSSVNVADLTVDFARTINPVTMSGTTGGEITDIELVDTTLFFFASTPWISEDTRRPDTLGKILKVAAPAGAGAALTLTNVTPNFQLLNGDTRRAGAYYFIHTGVYSDAVLTGCLPLTNVNNVIRHPLFYINSTTVGCALVIDHWSTHDIPYYYDSTSTNRFIKGLFCVPVTTSDDTTTMSKLYGLYTNVASGFSLYWIRPQFGSVGVVYDDTGTDVIMWSIDTGTNRYCYRVLPTMPVNAGDIGEAGLEAVTPIASAPLVNQERLSVLVGTDAYLTKQYDEVGTSTLTTTFTADAVPSAGIGNSLYTVTAAAAEAGGNLTADTTYFYRFSVMYEDLHESPLSTADSSTTADVDDFTIPVTIEFTDYERLGLRVSSIKVYRASAPGTIAVPAAEPEGYYRLIKTIPFTLTDVSVTLADPLYTIHFHDTSEEVAGVSYEASTGISETLASGQIQFAKSAFIGQEMFVADFVHTEIPDSAYLLMRSKVGRPCMFNWVSDIMRLDFVPTALVPFAGKLLAFSQDKFLVINPSGMYIEEEIEGYGILHDAAWTVTDIGLIFIAPNSSKVLLYNGKTVTNIGFPIESTKNTFARSLENQVAGYHPCLPVSAETLGGIFIPTYHETTADGTTTPYFGLFVFSYKNGEQRWDYWTVTAATFNEGGDFQTSLVSAPLGELLGITYLVDNSTKANYTICTNATRKQYVWYSPMLIMGDATLKKRFTKLILSQEGSGTPTLYISYDAGSFTSISITPSSQNTPTYFRRLMFYFTSSSGAAEAISQFVIWARRLVGIHNY